MKIEDPLVLGVDIGGSHITAGLVDLGKRKIISTSIKHMSVNPHENADVILSSWCQVIEDVYKGLTTSEKRIGIAVPGPFDYQNGICLIKEQDKFKSLYGMDIKNELARRLNIAWASIEFINDAAAFLKGEIFAGPAQSPDSVLGITLGTGLGSALYTRGKVSDADLWNSSFLDGIAEEYLAAGWFIDRYYQLTGIKVTGVKEIMNKVSGAPDAKQVFSEFGKNLAQFLRPLVTKYDLKMVIIGGNISYAFSQFSGELNDELATWQKQVVIKVSNLKENAALIGAAVERVDKSLNGRELHNYKTHEI